jgi:Ca2+-binding EF-hand superfamily protein
VNNYAEVYGEKPESPKHQDLVSRYRGQWTQLQAFDADQDGVVAQEEYVAGMEAWLADRRRSRLLWTRSSVRIVDQDNDGRIDEEEPILNYRAHGLDEAAATAAFAKLDRNSDGVISKDEMVTSILEA